MLISFFVTLFVAIQDPIIQRFAVRFVGGYFSEKTGADIKVGRIAVSPDFRVFVDNVSVKDLKGNNLARIGKLRAKFHIADLLEGKIHLGHVELNGTEANLIKYEGEEGFNFKFLADFFSSGKEKDKDENKNPIPIFVDRISLKDISFQLWDQNRADSLKQAQNIIDYAHLKLDDLNFEARHFSMVGDSIYAVVEKLSANELSGLQLKHFQSDVVFCQKGIFLKGTQIETNNSLLQLDLDMKYSGLQAFKSFVDSVFFDATLYSTDVLLTDIGFFSAVMYEMPNRVRLKGRFSGPIANFSVNDIDLSLGRMTNIKGDLSMHPLDFENGEHVLKIKNMRFSYDDLNHFHIPGKTGTLPMPASMSALETGNIKLDFRGSYNNFVSHVTLVSEVGNVEANVSRNRQGDGYNLFSGDINGERINAGLFANARKVVGLLDLDAEFSAMFPKNGAPDLSVNGTVYRADLLGNHIDEIQLNGDMKENRFNGKINVDDDELGLDFNGLIDFSNAKHPKSDFVAVIRHADLKSLDIMKEDSISEISTKIHVDMTGFNLDDLEGKLHIDSTLYRDSRGEYFMKSLDAGIINDKLMQRRIKVDCDFFSFEMGGLMNFANLLPSLNEYGDSFVHFPIWAKDVEEFQQYKQNHDVDQDFFIQLNIGDAKTLCRLFMPQLQIAKNTTVNATFTSRSRLLNVTARSKYFRWDKLSVNDFELKNFNSNRASYGTLSLGEVSWTNITESDTVSYGLDNISFFAKMANDTIATRVIWDDVSDDDHNKALVETVFHPHEGGGVISISTADLLINDTLWQVAPDNYIDFDTGRIEVSNIWFGHNGQSIRMNGYVPMGVEDTLALQLDKFNVSMLDILTVPSGFDIDGLITGSAQVANLKGNPMVLADLAVEGLGMNGDHIGDASIKSSWDNAEQSVKVDVDILTGNTQSLCVLGTYYTKREDNLDFNVSMDSLRLAIISPFMAGQISRIQGFGSGNVKVTGPLKQPKVNGSLSVVDGGCKVAYLNTFYSFSPTILLDSNVIELKDMVLTDTLGNKAPVEGKIYHDHFKDFVLDFRLHPREFLVMATTLKDNDSFYGNVIANGLATVKGPLKDIVLDVKAMTCKGTQLALPLNRVSTVSDNDFIVFINNVENEEDEIDEAEVEVNDKSKFALNIDVNVTDDAGVKINLPGDIGTIDATGSGNLKLGTSTSEALTLFGNYIINSGRFQLNFKEILSRTFTLKSGGTISWSGSPTDGRIDATGVYSVKTSLSTLGIQVDSTSGNSNVNVECLIHLKDALLNPNITFGMNLPNASDDVNQTVYSLIDTTNQAVMSEQVLSLLVLGSFSYAGSSANGSSGISAIDALARNLLSGLSFEVTKDVDLGLKYHLGSGSYSYDEFQVALKTELFENRLIIETNFGVVTDNAATENASNLVGEVDLYYKLFKDGRLMAHFYNHSNYNTNYSSFAFDRLAPYTQGLGLSYSKSFDTFHDLFRRKQTTPAGRPLLSVPNKSPIKP